MLPADMMPSLHKNAGWSVISSVFQSTHDSNRTRTLSGASGSEEEFDSGKDSSCFDTGNGTVPFTNASIEQIGSQQTYQYTITAYDPFGISVESELIDVIIPEKSALDPAAPGAFPETGDSANPMLWAALAAASAICMMMLRKRKEA